MIAVSFLSVFLSFARSSTCLNRSYSKAFLRVGTRRERKGHKRRYFIELFMCLISHSLTTVWRSFFRHPRPSLFLVVFIIACLVKSLYFSPILTIPSLSHHHEGMNTKSNFNKAIAHDKQWQLVVG